MTSRNLRWGFVAAALGAGLVVLAAGEGLAEVAATGSVEVRVTGARSAKGTVWVHLWDRPAGYPRKLATASQRRSAPIRGGEAVATFEGLRPGSYAAFAYHDEDGDGSLRTNFIGMPTEGVGASNGAKGRMGPPSFAAARFEVGSGRSAVLVPLRYL